MQRKKEDYRIFWAIMLLSGPLVLLAVFWNGIFRSPTDKLFDQFMDKRVSVFRGYPEVVDTKQELFLKENRHKLVMKQPFYLEPIEVDPKKVQGLVAFLASESSPESTDPAEMKACAFHADLLIEINNEPSRPQVLVCSSCADIWIGTSGNRTAARAINPKKYEKLKRLVFDILGKPAEWPPELQD